MTVTLSDLLRAADPLRDEPLPNAQERLLRRQSVLSTPPVKRGVSRRRFSLVGVGAVLLIGIGAGARYWTAATANLVAAVRFEIRLAEESSAPALREATVGGESRKIYLHADTVVTNSDIAEAHVSPGNAPSTFGVVVTFTADGAAKMQRATQNHIGRPLAILIDGQVVIAPVLRSRITSSAVVSGDYTRAEAERIVAGIVGQ